MPRRSKNWENLFYRTSSLFFQVPTHTRMPLLTFKWNSKTWTNAKMQKKFILIAHVPLIPTTLLLSLMPSLTSSSKTTSKTVDFSNNFIYAFFRQYEMEEEADFRFVKPTLNILVGNYQKIICPSRLWSLTSAAWSWNCNSEQQKLGS